MFRWDDHTEITLLNTPNFNRDYNLGYATPYSAPGEYEITAYVLGQEEFDNDYPSLKFVIKDSREFVLETEAAILARDSAFKGTGTYFEKYDQTEYVKYIYDYDGNAHGPNVQVKLDNEIMTEEVYGKYAKISSCWQTEIDGWSQEGYGFPKEKGIYRYMMNTKYKGLVTYVEII